MLTHWFLIDASQDGVLVVAFSGGFALLHYSDGIGLAELHCRSRFVRLVEVGRA